MEEALVTGVALDKNQVVVTLREVPDRPGVAAEIFGALGAAHVNVDMIIQSSAHGGTNAISFTLETGDLRAAKRSLQSLRSRWKTSLETSQPVAKVSIVGVGMRSHSGVAGTMFGALADHKINIQMIATSEIKISCVIDRKDGERAVRALHSAFGLSGSKH